MADLSHERADVLAYLAQRRAHLARLAAKDEGSASDSARVQMRQLDVLADDLRGGLHEGAAV